MKGRKRHLLVDTMGLVLQALVHPANATDRVGGQQRLEAVDDRGQTVPRLRHLWVARASRGSCKDWVEQTLGWTVQVVTRPARWVWRPADQAPLEPSVEASGFQVVPRRWGSSAPSAGGAAGAVPAQTTSISRPPPRVSST